MSKDAIIKKLEDTIASMREALAKNEGSTIQTLTSGAKSVFGSVKNSVLRNETTQKVVTESKKYLNDFENTVKSGDKKLSASLLDKAQKFLEGHRTRKEDKKGSKEADKAEDKIEDSTESKEENKAENGAETKAENSTENKE